MTTTCDKCGVLLHIGDHPFCPHGRSQVVSFHDDIPGGLVLENYGPVPITVYSHTERRRIMAERGLVEREKHAPLPGTDKDPHIPNPNGYRDLSAAAILMRNGQGTTPANKDRTSGGDSLDPSDWFDIPNEPGYKAPAVRHFNIGYDPRED